MRIGVTGAGGFIGTHLVSTLVERGHEVRGFGHRATHGLTPLDLPDQPDLAGLLQGLDAVVHAAAYVPSTASFEEARRCLEVNALGTLAMLKAAEASSVGCFILISGNIYRPGPVPVAEDAPIEPLARAPHYLASKAYADFMAEQAHRDGKLRVVILRASSVFGPGLRRGMLPLFAERLARRERVTISDGDRYRVDLTYVEDLARVTATALERDVAGPFNVGAGSTASARQLAELLAHALGAPPDLVDVEPSRGMGYVGFAPLNIARAKAQLDYLPTSVEIGIQKFVHWWRAR